MAYQAERLPSGLTRFEAPNGQHDDTVMALAMAWSAVSSQHRMIYPVPDSRIVVKDFAIPEHWPRGYGLDVRWRTTAAVWCTLDPESDVLYLYSEYLGEAESAVHVATIRARGAWIPGLMDAQANGRGALDGSALIRMHRGFGLVLQAIDNPLESGVLKLWERIDSGRLKVFDSVSKYRDQLRLYRRNERDQIVRENDNLLDAARCLVNGIARLSCKPVISVVRPRVYVGDRSWMA